jgi:hypothetical protein
MRQAHRLKSNKGSEYPSNLIFFDTETYPEVLSPVEVRHRFRLGSAIYWRRRTGKEKDMVEDFAYTSSAAFYDFVFTRATTKHKLYLISHNLDFDMAVLGLYKVLADRGYTLKSFWEKPPARYMKWVKEKSTIVCMDNGNYFKGKLAKIGEDVGFPKEAIDFATCTEAELSSYNLRDTRILYELWKRWIMFCKENDLGCFGQTLAAQAFSAYKHRFMPHEIFIHDRVPVIGLERMSYTGGRTEAFRIGDMGEGPFYSLDINGMYPFVMKAHEYPVKLKAYKLNCSLSFLRFYLRRYCLTAHVILRTEEAIFPYKLDFRTLFPTGEFDAYLSTPEIAYALEHDLILKVLEVAVYEKADIFSSYIDFFYSKRLEARDKGESMLSYYYKILMNSLYGKFGQKSSSWEQVGTTDSDEISVTRAYNIPTKRWYSIRIHNHIIEQSQEEEEAYNSFPAIAAHVTAYSRMYLWWLMCQAGRENVYYCDTDSVFTNQAGRDRLKHLLDDKALGKLKVDKEAGSLLIWGAKDYVFGKIKHIKGVREEAKEVSEGVYEQERWNGFATRVKQGDINTYTVTLQTKHLRREYVKGAVDAEGVVTPWRIPEDIDTYMQAVRSATSRGIPDTQAKLLEAWSLGVRRLVLKLGGVKDKDYESLPKWAKRRGGMALDLMAAPLNSEGYGTTSAEEVYALLWQATPEKP